MKNLGITKSHLKSILDFRALRNFLTSCQIKDTSNCKIIHLIALIYAALWVCGENRFRYKIIKGMIDHNGKMPEFKELNEEFCVTLCA